MNQSVEEVRRQKAQLRQEALRRRAKLEDKDGRSLAICQNLLALPEFQAARTILFYVHYGDEVRTQPMLRWLLGEVGGGSLWSAFFGEAKPFEPEQAKPEQTAAGKSSCPEKPQPSSEHFPESSFPKSTAQPPAEQAPRIKPTFLQRQLLVPYCLGKDLKLFRLRSMAELEPGSFGILEPRRELRELPDRQASIQEVDLVVVPGVAFDRKGGRLGHGRGYYDRLLANARQDTVLVGLAYQCQILPELPLLPSDVRMDIVLTESDLYRPSPAAIAERRGCG
ncbi:MAG: 5-formyltetrahydrofolate cyclo-ligase [Thermoguttaceae bacterium]|nr:5-formyltetrahydrofolate cyclo-ligase [Thermoguttaceae bacterium]MDW8037492.1 5-formyltetrahydrofolate cyclo-ligase [Thermoguttaceae bacterium]